jgi:CRP-like cAMP-binding protein
MRRALAPTGRARGVSRHPQPSFSRNRLLSILPADDFDRLRPQLQRVSLEFKQVLEQPNTPIPYVYFLEPAVGSIVASTPSGERLEVGMFGPEGMSGLAVVQGSDRSPHESFMQVPGEAIRITAAALSEALDESASLRRLLLRYAQAYSLQVAYTALANGRYSIDERLARWLVMCHDRVDGDAFPITHEFLALMLGVRRAGVTTALQSLEGLEVIKASRGRIDILDRDELIKCAGGSYGVAEAEYERLIA